MNLFRTAVGSGAGMTGFLSLLNSFGGAILETASTGPKIQQACTNLFQTVVRPGDRNDQSRDAYLSIV